MVNVTKGVIAFVIFILLIVIIFIGMDIFSQERTSVNNTVLWHDIFGVILLALSIIAIITLIYSSMYENTSEKEKIKEKEKVEEI